MYSFCSVFNKKGIKRCTYYIWWTKNFDIYCLQNTIQFRGTCIAEVDKYEITPDGKKIKLYRSRIGKVEIILDDLEPTLSLHPNLTNSKSIS